MLVVVAAVISVFADVSLASRVAVSADGTASLPITKVVQLLKDMQKELEAEAKNDKETFESLRCWCETNEKGKNQAVEDAKNRIDQLEASIEQNSGSTGELQVTINDIKKDLAASIQALKEATELRKKEAAAFHDQEKEIINSVGLLKGAIVALSNQHGGSSMIQEANMAKIKAMQPALRHLVHQHLDILSDILGNTAEKDTLLGFINADSDILEPDVGAPAFVQEQKQQNKLRASLPFKSYAPQSGQIMGVLKQMKDNFEATLPEIQKDEQGKAGEFAELKGSKESEMKALQEQEESKTIALANTKEQLAEDKINLRDTLAGLSVDQKFLLELTDRCTRGDHEWEERFATRMEEIKAVSEAIGILTTDEVKDGQQTTFGAKSFLQLSSSRGSSSGSSPRERAVAYLSKVVDSAKKAKKSSSTAASLALVLASVQNDAFSKVIKAIDELGAKLKQQQADEVSHRDFCVAEFHDNEVVTARKNAELERLIAEIEDLTSRIKTLKDEVATLTHEIATMQGELQRATLDRQAENKEFQKTIEGQIKAKVALQMALERLDKFYHTTRLLQTEAEEEAPVAAPELTTVAPSPEFKDYKNSGGSTKAMKLIQQCIGDATVVMDEAKNGEQNAEAAYETLIGDTNDSIKVKSRSIADKIEEAATLGERKEGKILDKDQTSADLVLLGETKAELHAQCDFLMANFGARQEARAAEMDAINEVKAILGGMK